MRIHTFHTDFTNDLQSFVKDPVQFVPLIEWNPEKVASPERHLFNGIAINIPFDIQVYTLEKENEMFEQISSMLRIYLDRTILRGLTKIDAVKEQVWLFGAKWLSIYYELLTDPEILKSEFYKNYHDDFLSIVGKMLDMNPRKRITFIQALRLWNPSCAEPINLLQDTNIVISASSIHNDTESEEESIVLPIVESTTESTTEPTIEPTSITSVTSSTTSAMPSVTPSVMSSVLPSVTPSVMSSVSAPISFSTFPSTKPPVSTSIAHRLVLNAPRHISELTKTRKNLRNSNHFPANDNHEQQT